jgi:hypothetical protein
LGSKALKQRQAMPYKMKHIPDLCDQLEPETGSHQNARMTSVKQLLYLMNGLISGEAALRR